LNALRDKIMATLESWINEMADGEAIEAVVIGEMGWGDYGSEDVPGYKEQSRGKALSWEAALPSLQYEFSDGYGAPGCNAICAWTKSWVIGVSQYDGSTSPFRMPRNPTDHKPQMPGG
jgi:hypothetical protein